MQALPSLQAPVALVLVQVPVAGSQASIVQALPSSQFTGGWEHWPVAGSQTSCVQRSPSAQFFGLPWQEMVPAGDVMQVSPSEHGLPSSQTVPGSSARPAHWPVSPQTSSTVQAFRSSHEAPACSAVPWHWPAVSQASFRVQPLPSSQDDPAGIGA